MKLAFLTCKCFGCHLPVLAWIAIGLWFLPGPVRAEECQNLSQQEIEAFEYLNQFRADPHPHARKLGINQHPLKPAIKLRWNSRLASVARWKAEDMGRNNYFDHRDSAGKGPNQRVVAAGYSLPAEYPLDPGANSLESLAAGYGDGIKVIDQLILDENISPPKHRLHLLALDEFWQEHSEVGIGIACIPGSTYTYYTVVLTAPALPVRLSSARRARNR